MKITIVRAGPLTSVQDTGRCGWRRNGVGLSGALDSCAARVLNLLVGNEQNIAVLEVSAGNFRVRIQDERLLAWGGASFETKIADRSILPGRPFTILPGEEFSMTNPRQGCRAWLAISGGIDVPLLLGSRSTDLRGGFGGFENRALRDGDELSLGEPTRASKKLSACLQKEHVFNWSAPQNWTSAFADQSPLRILRGADWALFEPSAHHGIISEIFTVTAEADRMGLRLAGLKLKRVDHADLLSEAVAPGTIQVPANGQPILLLGDCQTLGGYPKIADVISVDLPKAAQFRPGDRVRFQEIDLAEAQALLVRRERDLAFFRAGLETLGS